MTDYTIRAGTVDEIKPESGEWLVIDMGFSEKGKSCGVVRFEGQGKTCRFGEMVDEVVKEMETPGPPLNLVIEAPLSVAFNDKGNPTPRTVELAPSGSRPWYFNAGAGILIATMHLLHRANYCHLRRDVRLFEGFVSFKTKGKGNSHILDATKLLNGVSKNLEVAIYGPGDLPQRETDHVESAFAVAGMDFGIPPVIAAS